MPFLFRVCGGTALAVVALLGPAVAAAQPAPTPTVTLPTVTVTAQKEPADAQKVPVSVTAVSKEWLRGSDVTFISDAAILAPNTVFTEFTARKLSNARVRGVGSSPANPAITTYIDGVPQLNANASSLEFTGIEQVEFVRGPQSALFGRNTLGGVINIASERPSLASWNGTLTAPFGNHASREVRGGVSGPISERWAVGVSGGHSERDGFTINTRTGNDLDSRSANFGKAQALWTPSRRWETRVIISAERGRDGDYALNDLDAVRRTPFEVQRNFEGFTNRDVFNTTLLNRYEGGRVAVTATSGVVRWNTDDSTDLDYTERPIATRSNVEKASQFTQEVRVASSAVAPLRLGSSATLRWQSGLLVFTQDYHQDAVNSLGAFTLSPQIPFPVRQTSPRAALDDVGVGIYAQATATVRESLDVTFGARLDRESKTALLETFYDPMIAPPATVDAEEDFSNISPQVAIAYRLHPNRMLYASAARGFKAGGFNPASPSGNEAYGEEHTWNVEGGAKTTWAGGRLNANASAFFIDWTDLQLNLPNPRVPGQFYVSNVGSATSRGVELELNARPAQGVDVFSSMGYTRARFGDGTISSGVDVAVMSTVATV